MHERPRGCLRQRTSEVVLRDVDPQHIGHGIPGGWETSCTRNTFRHDSRACANVGVLVPVATTTYAEASQPAYLQDCSDIGRAPASESCWTTRQAVDLHGPGIMAQRLKHLHSRRHANAQLNGSKGRPDIEESSGVWYSCTCQAVVGQGESAQVCKR